MKSFYKAALYIFPLIILGCACYGILQLTSSSLYIAIAVCFLVAYYVVLHKVLAITKTVTDADIYVHKRMKDAESYYMQEKGRGEKEKNAAFVEAKRIRAEADEYEKVKRAKANSYLKEETQRVKADLEESQHVYAAITEQIEQLQSTLSELEIAKKAAEDESLIFDTHFNMDYDISSAEYKNKLSISELEEKELISNGQAVVVLINAPQSSIVAMKKQILRCFQAETANILKAVTAKNADTQRGKLTRSFEAINRIFKPNGVELRKRLLQYKLDQLNYIYANQLALAHEKEEQQAIKQQLMEEAKVQKEIEREKTSIEREQKRFQGEIKKLMSYLQKASDLDKQLYIDKISELEAKLKQLETDKQHVLEREANTRAGYVYIISNIGSFGEDIYKIGVTRRLEPMDRIKELSSASVPFEFDVHAMIFSEDAPALETALHRYFDDRRVNMVNLRKEFFHVTLPEIEKVVRENHNATVHFTAFAKAEEYRRTLELTQQAIN